MGIVADVRFGSKADIAERGPHVRFVPLGDIEPGKPDYLFLGGADVDSAREPPTHRDEC